MLSSDRYELAPGLWLDARRAVWFAEEQVLAVADLHLGYVWAQRHAGQLFPLNAPDDTLDRLLELQQTYQPRQLVLLGDIVHRAIDLPAIRTALQELAALTSVCQVRFIAGNHDCNLPRLIEALGLNQLVETEVNLGPHRLLHGDQFDLNLEKRMRPEQEARGFVVIGHEHPVIWLGDGVASSAKCPCFLAGPRLLILPAFSGWAAGVRIKPAGFMSRLARSETFTQAVAIVGRRLLPIPWP